MLQTHTTQNESETAQLATTFAQFFIDASQKNPRLLCLSGPLGAGKSIFARSLIRALTNMPGLTVPSPTFTLVQTYESTRGPIHHYDLYRLESIEEIDELGWDDALADGITLVEWPERLAGMALPPRLDITIKPSENGGDSRTITITQTE